MSIGTPYQDIQHMDVIFSTLYMCFILYIYLHIYVGLSFTSITTPRLVAATVRTQPQTIHHSQRATAIQRWNQNKYHMLAKNNNKFNKQQEPEEEQKQQQQPTHGQYQPYQDGISEHGELNLTFSWTHKHAYV